MESGPLLLGSEKRELSNGSKPSELFGEHSLEFAVQAGEQHKSYKTVGMGVCDEMPPRPPWVKVAHDRDVICGAFPRTAQLCRLGAEHSTKAATRQACVVILVVGCAFAIIMTATYFMYAATQKLGTDEDYLGHCNQQPIANGIMQAGVENSRVQVVCNTGFLSHLLPRDVGHLTCGLLSKRCTIVRRKPVTDGEARHCKRTFAFTLRQYALSPGRLGMGDEGTLDAARRAAEVALRGVCVPQPAHATGSHLASYAIPVGEAVTELSPNVSVNAAGVGKFGGAQKVQSQPQGWSAAKASAAMGALLMTAITAVICAGISRGGFNDGSIAGNEPDTAPLLDDDGDDVSSDDDDDDDDHKGGTLMPTAGASNESSGSDD